MKEKWIVLSAVVLLLAGCTISGSDQGPLEPGVGEDPQIEEPAPPSLSYPDVVEGSWPAGWLDDGILLVLEEAPALAEGLPFHVSDVLTRLGRYDFADGTWQALGDPQRSQLSASVSPDGERVFIVEYLPVAEGERSAGTGRILDAMGSEMVVLDTQDLTALRSVAWGTDNTLVMIDGSVIRVIEESGVERLRVTIESSGTAGQAAYAQGRLYYTVLETRMLWEIHPNGESRILAEDVAAFTVSPVSGAVTWVTRPDTGGLQKLMLYEAASGQTSEVDRGSFIYGPTWSRDGNLLAYYRRGDETGLYWMERGTEVPVLIAEEAFGQELPMWNPSGDAVAVGFTQMDQNGQPIREIHLYRIGE